MSKRNQLFAHLNLVQNEYRIELNQQENESLMNNNHIKTQDENGDLTANLNVMY